MSQAVPANVAASVKQRLLNRARERKEDFNLLLTKYGLERIPLQDRPIEAQGQVRAQRSGCSLSFMEAARLPVQIDLGFGDAVTSGPIETDFPTLLQSPAPRLLSYPRETVLPKNLKQWLS